ncbi:MAG TPA: ubiquinone/menaquinone biosynthesis methyltransferase [Solirubrobacteraceae bacterium]|nr:ubiquinone/menaquinone biosynthesis methyltransferase [Solirubrobacteraceae bacterium]
MSGLDPADPADYSAGRLQAGQVQSMFDRVAGVYDLLNTVMTAGLHHRWRERAVDCALVGPGGRVLDVATGTGDLALALARRVGPDGSVVGSDFSEGMLARARAKAQGCSGAKLTFESGDALDLPYPDGRFDAATVGFGARNFSDLSRGLREMARVVRPGGRVVVLEMTTPTKPPLSWFFGLWFDRVVPVIGKLAAAVSRRRGDGQDTIAQAYTYLPSSVKRFHSPRELAAELERAGCIDVRYTLMAGGIIALHGATVRG